MPSRIKLILIVTVAVVGLAAAPALYAHDSRGSSGSMMGSGMMGQGGMMGGMMGMMNMMSNMMSGRSEMAQGCSQMMQGMQGGGSQRPNEQWRPQPTPDKGN